MYKLIQSLIILLALTTSTAPANENYIVIDGTQINATVYGAYLPLRDIVEHIGGTVSWSGRTQQITIRHGRQNVILTIGSRYATINNIEIQLAKPPQIINGQTMMPSCFFSDHLALGAGHINNTFILSTTPARRIPVLVYHHILPEEVPYFQNNAWTISAENFTQQMQYLNDNGFYTPTLDELEAFIYHGRPLPQNSVMIHFDDGYYSNFVYAYPILQYYGLRAVLFPITGVVESLSGYQPAMSYNNLVHASADTLHNGKNIFETASHSHNLHDFAPCRTQTLLVMATHDEIVADILQSFAFVSNHRAFAYPLGQYNSTVIEALQEAGITMGFTVTPRYVTTSSDPFRLGRFTIYRETQMSRFRNIVNGRL